MSGDRFQALEPIRQGVREHFGGFDRGIATGLAIRHDHGSASMSDDFQQELAESSSAGTTSTGWSSAAGSGRRARRGPTSRRHRGV
jgi:hypothetical protein